MKIHDDKVLGPVVTTSTAAQTVGTFTLGTLQNGENILVDVQIFAGRTALDTESTAVAEVKRAITYFFHNGGTVTQAPQTVTTTLFSISTLIGTITLDYSGGAFRVRVTPASAVSIRFLASAEIKRML